MNYEYVRQNNQHVTKNCTGLTMNYAHETGNNRPLRLNYAHAEKIMQIYLNNNHFLPTWHPVLMTLLVIA